VRCRRRFAALVSVFAGLTVFATAALSQDVILSFEWTAERLSVPPGGQATIGLIARNDAVYEADDLELEIELGETGFEVAVEPELLAKIAPFGEATLLITVRVPEDVAEGEFELRTDALYTYCIEESCFLIAEPLTLRVVVEAGVDPVLPTPVAQHDPWPPVVIGLVLGGLAVSLALARRSRWRIPAILLLTLAAGLGLAYGTLRTQHEQAKSIGASLCVSCVGLEPTTHHAPELTAAEEQLLAGVTEASELLVFSARWCHACPIAKAFVAAVDEASPGITHRVVDVEEEPGLAEAFGVVRGGRTVVPAIARVDTEELFFGTEDLKARLFALLDLPAGVDEEADR